MKKILHFLFGSLPKIFNKKGEVYHDLGASRWESWKNRYKYSNEYNWRYHAGKRHLASRFTNHSHKSSSK